MNPGGSEPGIQRVQDLAFSTGSSYVVQLNGPDPGAGYDQLTVTGTVSLDDATLDASLGFSPVQGQRFVIIENDGTEQVSGTFAGLPQGASLSIGGVPFHVYYDGGDGNDVALVRNVPPALTAPADQTAFQNVDLSIKRLGVTDVDDGKLTVTLAVSHGTLTLSEGDFSFNRHHEIDGHENRHRGRHHSESRFPWHAHDPLSHRSRAGRGLTVDGNGTTSLTLIGSQAALNASARVPELPARPQLQRAGRADDHGERRPRVVLSPGCHSREVAGRAANRPGEGEAPMRALRHGIR